MRFYIQLPLLLSELFIDLLGTISADNEYLYYLRLLSSLSFLVWMLGWLSTFKNNFYFVTNTINRYMFGDESKISFIHAFIGLSLNIIVIGIYSQVDGNISQIALIIGATITSILSFIIFLPFLEGVSLNESNQKVIITIVIEIVICTVLSLLVGFISFNENNLNIILGFDIGLYVLFSIINQIHVARTSLGLSVNCSFLCHWVFTYFQRLVLRIVSAFCIIYIANSLTPALLSTNLNRSGIII
eukprot:GHVR01035475.1.p1 GENE.GHVR01035475.1~~GHVR01035475.1.p1  ORF type:complete len:244 (-),score=-18.56 GHVR01035475.1:2048-2779(-)